MGGIVLLIWKDLRIELRTRGMVVPLAVVGVLLVVVLARGGGVSRTGSGAATILWAAFLVAGILGVERGMAVEREAEGLAGVLLTPVDRGSVFLAKLASNLLQMGVAAAAVSVVGMMLLGLKITGSVWGFATAMGLGLVGVAAAGTLFAAAVGGVSGRRGLLALLLLPVCVPAVIVSTRLAASMADPGVSGPGFGVLIAFDVVYVAAGWLAFEHVVET